MKNKTTLLICGAAFAVLGLVTLPGCASTGNISSAQQQQIDNEILSVSGSAAVGAATNAITQYDATGKVDPAKVGAAAASAGIAALPTPTPASAATPAAP